MEKEYEEIKEDEIWRNTNSKVDLGLKNTFLIFPINISV